MSTTNPSRPDYESLITCLNTLIRECGEIPSHRAVPKAYIDLYYHAESLARTADEYHRRVPGESSGSLAALIQSNSFRRALRQAHEEAPMGTDQFRVDDDDELT
jgi:hypothetical protein